MADTPPPATWGLEGTVAVATAGVRMEAAGTMEGRSWFRATVGRSVVMVGAAGFRVLTTGRRDAEFTASTATTNTFTTVHPEHTHKLHLKFKAEIPTLYNTMQPILHMVNLITISK